MSVWKAKQKRTWNKVEEDSSISETIKMAGHKSIDGFFYILPSDGCLVEFSVGRCTFPNE